MKNLIYKLKYMAAIVACFAVCMNFSACSNSEDEPYGAFNPNDPAVQAILGSWSNGSMWPDFLWDDQARTTWGGGSRGEGYGFKDDGTFVYSLMGHNQNTNAYHVHWGNYRVQEDKLFLYNKKADFVDRNNPGASYRNRPTGDQTLHFEVLPYYSQYSPFTQQLKITNPTLPAGYQLTTFFR